MIDGNGFRAACGALIAIAGVGLGASIATSADPEWVADGMLTAKGVGELKARLPFADLTKIEDNPAVDRIGDLYTVDMLVQYVQSKLAA